MSDHLAISPTQSNQKPVKSINISIMHIVSLHRKLHLKKHLTKHISETLKFWNIWIFFFIYQNAPKITLLPQMPQNSPPKQRKRGWIDHPNAQIAHVVALLGVQGTLAGKTKFKGIWEKKTRDISDSPLLNNCYYLLRLISNTFKSGPRHPCHCSKLCL